MKPELAMMVVEFLRGLQPEVSNEEVARVEATLRGGGMEIDALRRLRANYDDGTGIRVCMVCGCDLNSKMVEKQVRYPARRVPVVLPNGEVLRRGRLERREGTYPKRVSSTPLQVLIYGAAVVGGDGRHTDLIRRDETTRLRVCAACWVKAKPENDR